MFISQHAVTARQIAAGSMACTPLAGRAEATGASPAGTAIRMLSVGKTWWLDGLDDDDDGAMTSRSER
jgi:hypothetical protein